MIRPIRSVFLFQCLMALAVFPPHSHAFGDESVKTPQPSQLYRDVVQGGLRFLADQGQAEDGTFSSTAGPGVTALAITAALRHDQPLNHSMVAKGLKALEGFVKPDGGIYGSGRLRNYETCVAILCFAEANEDGRYNQLLSDAKRFVTAMQYGIEPGMVASDPWYGGVGYGGAGRPDLSNTSYFIEALQALEERADSAAIQRAVVFVSRCQNLQSEHNMSAFAGLVNDGGFYYFTPATKVDPSTSERYAENGGLRSYGAMTYAGLKSMIYAGLQENDPRVKAALAWITRNYSVARNPGMGNAGLYYYYHTFAASLDASGKTRVADASGVAHDWRLDLIQELAKRQQKDGSWRNTNERWFESDRNLATSFALLALAHCKK